eukprot:g429.t1
MLGEAQGVSEFPSEFTIPNEGLKGPGHRAISVANLERVLEFFKALERKGPGGKIVNSQCNPDFNPPDTRPNFVPVEEVTMNYVNAYLVMPVTRFAGTSFASLVRKEGADIRPHHFVSHNWKGSYQHFVDSILSHYNRVYGGKPGASKEDTYYWVCTFANNQHRVSEELGGEIDEGPFAVAISDVKSRHGQVVAVQDDSKPSQFTLSRGWCVFEMEFSLLQQMPIVFSCDNGALIEQGAYVDERSCRCDWVQKMKDWTFEHVCEAPKASCARPDDVKSISKYIDENPVTVASGSGCNGGKDCLGQAVRGLVSGIACTSTTRRASLHAYAQAHGGVIPLSGPDDAATAAGRARRVEAWQAHIESLKGTSAAANEDGSGSTAVSDPSCSALTETKSCMDISDEASRERVTRRFVMPAVPTSASAGLLLLLAWAGVDAASPSAAGGCCPEISPASLPGLAEGAAWDTSNFYQFSRSTGCDADALDTPEGCAAQGNTFDDSRLYCSADLMYVRAPDGLLRGCCSEILALEFNGVPILQKDGGGPGPFVACEHGQSCDFSASCDNQCDLLSADRFDIDGVVGGKDVLDAWKRIKKLEQKRSWLSIKGKGFARSNQCLKDSSVRNDNESNFTLSVLRGGARTKELSDASLVGQGWRAISDQEIAFSCARLVVSSFPRDLCPGGVANPCSGHGECACGSGAVEHPDPSDFALTCTCSDDYFGANCDTFCPKEHGTWTPPDAGRKPGKDDKGIAIQVLIISIVGAFSLGACTFLSIKLLIKQLSHGGSRDGIDGIRATDRDNFLHEPFLKLDGLPTAKNQRVMMAKSSNQGLAGGTPKSAWGEGPSSDPWDENFLMDASRLKLRQKIGGGTSGEVFLANYDGASAVAAKKLFTPVAKTLALDSLAFRREVALLSQLNHPNIVQLLGVCYDDHRSCIIITELCVGSLRDIIDSQAGTPMPNELAACMALQIASGMLYLHERNVIHRDLKPANCLLTGTTPGATLRPGSTFTVKICDFGLSRVKQSDLSITEMTAEVGTPAYMAPELVSEESAVIDTVDAGKAVDVYSFGLTVLEIFTCVRPYSDIPLNNAFHLMIKVVGGMRPTIPLTRGSNGRDERIVPLPIEDIIRSCWNKVPHERPPFVFIVDKLQAYVSEAQRRRLRDQAEEGRKDREGAAVEQGVSERKG